MAILPEASPRIVNLHAEFNPDGNPRDNIGSLMDLWIETQNHILCKKRRVHVQHKKQWDELKAAVEKISPLLQSLFQGERSGEEVSEEISKLVPREDLRRKAFDWYTLVLSKKPEEIEKRSAELEIAENEHGRTDQALKHSRSILNSLSRLSDAAQQGDPQASAGLYDAAVMATSLLAIVTRRHPEQFKAIAAMKNTWPVLAREEPGWEKSAIAQIEQLDLGKGLTAFKTRLKNVRGSDVNLPARRWARSAVRTIDETRWRIPFFMHFVKELGGADEWAEFAVSRNWKIADRPGWVSASMKLEPFSLGSFNEWKSVVRQLIRESIPDFHLLPEWSTQRATAEANGKRTPGEIQNAILDDIVSALKRLAPESAC